MNWVNYKFFCSDHYDVPLNEGHRFPMKKYSLLRQELIDQDIIDSNQFVFCRPIDYTELYIAHDSHYVNQVMSKSLESREAKKIGLPLTDEMINRALTSQNAFKLCVDQALIDGFSATLAGGTHHAHYASGEGFCFFNDFAFNVRRIGQKFAQKKILILDLDVHQGNGNSSILKDDENVFIVSFHGEKNYPYRKVASNIDIGFDDKTGDDIYLQKLDEVIKLLEKMSFDLIMYQAGVDVLEGDRFGKLSLSYEGIYQRDLRVFQYAKNNKIPIAMALGGGYHEDIDRIVKAYINTYLAAKSIFS